MGPRIIESTPESSKMSSKMTSENDVSLGRTIRELRTKRGLAQIELSKRTGIDPRTLAAIESGRIVTPSLASLKQIAACLDIPLKNLFGQAEAQAKGSFFLGNQRGEYTLEWPKRKFRIVSYLPKSSPLFAGKIILESRGQCDSETLQFKGQVLLQIIFGKIQLVLENNEHYLKEGQHILFDGRLTYSFNNPALRETTALLVTHPSIAAS